MSVSLKHQWKAFTSCQTKICDSLLNEFTTDLAHITSYHIMFIHSLGFQEEMETIHDLIYGATHLALAEADSETTFALDITFDSPNFSCQLMRMFRNVKEAKARTNASH